MILMNLVSTKRTEQCLDCEAHLVGSLLDTVSELCRWGMVKSHLGKIRFKPLPLTSRYSYGYDMWGWGEQLLHVRDRHKCPKLHCPDRGRFCDHILCKDLIGSNDLILITQFEYFPVALETSNSLSRAMYSVAVHLFLAHIGTPQVESKAPDSEEH